MEKFVIRIDRVAALTSATCACYCFALASCVFEDVFCSDCAIRVGVLPALSWSLSGVRVEKNCEKFLFFQMTFFVTPGQVARSLQPVDGGFVRRRVW